MACPRPFNSARLVRAGASHPSQPLFFFTMLNVGIFEFLGMSLAQQRPDHLSTTLIFTGTSILRPWSVSTNTVPE